MGNSFSGRPVISVVLIVAFCRAHLVPTYSFGENDVYRLAITSPQGSTTRRIQRFLQRRFGVAPIIFLGRGIFNYDFGLLPYRKPITTVGEYVVLYPNDADPKCLTNGVYSGRTHQGRKASESILDRSR